MIEKLKSLCFNAIIEKKIILHKSLVTNDFNITKSKNNTIGHFQLNNSIKIANIIKKDVNYVFKLIINYLTKHKININIIKINNFINFTLTIKLINDEAILILKKYNLKCEKNKIKKIILDYSSPNIAKEMHVGHLRSTIIGECLSNLFILLGHKVIKINHLGDWGTQFGILINYLKDKYNKDILLSKKQLKLSELSLFYKQAQLKFITNLDFKKSSKQEVIKLQKKCKLSINIWKKITQISKTEYKKIYGLLNITIQYKGESFYGDMLPDIINLLNKKQQITISDNAKCVYMNGFKNKNNDTLPIIIQKSDGGFNYSTTELASIYYRIKYHNPDKIIYITDVGQKIHFQMIFTLIKNLNLKNNRTQLIHVPLGLMLNIDGKKIKTRSGYSDKLIDLLYKAIIITKKNIIIKKYVNIKKIATIIGINTVKYSELSNTLDQNYVFDYNKMFKYNGNTATFLMYAYVRILSIEKKITKKYNYKDIIINITETEEIDLMLHILQYKTILMNACIAFNPNIITLYVYRLCEKFHLFFHTCKVIESTNESSRIAICNITKKILKISFNILGLKTINKI